MTGARFDERYELTGEIGRGGMGVVYRGVDRLLGREVAVKGIPPELLTPITEERFTREARTAAQLEHPSIVPIYDLVQHERSLFLVMPLLRGRTLRSVLSERRLLTGEALDVVAQVADALDYSHEQGVVHRDVKPENVMILSESDRSGRIAVRLMDFGVAWVAAEAARLTRTGGLVGTPSYASPEQIGGGDVDARADIYALGTVLFECLCGSTPFRGDLPAVLHQILHAPPPRLSERGAQVSAELEDLIARCLAKRPEDRPARAGDVVEVLVRLRSALPGAPALRPSTATLVRPAPPLAADRWSDVDGPVLAAAAVLGPELTLRDLSMLLPDVEPLEEAVDRLISAGKLKEQPGGAQLRLSFVSERERQAVYAALPRPRRREMHRAFAEALAAAHGDRADRVGDRLSFHFARAGLPAHAARHGVAAARRAVAEGRRSDALLCARLALEALDGVPYDDELASLDAEAREIAGRATSHESTMPAAPAPAASRGAPDSGLTDQLGDTLWLSGKYEEALEIYRRASAERRAGGAPVPRELQAQESLRLLRVLRSLGRYEEALAQAAEGMSALAGEASPLGVELAAWAGLTCCSQGDLDGAEVWLRTGEGGAERLGEASGASRARALALLARLEGNWLLGRGAAAGAVEAYRRGLAYSARAPDEWERSIALFNLGEAFLSIGDIEQAAYYLDAAEGAKASLGDRWGLVYVHLARARLLRERGRWLDALASLDVSLRIGTEIGDRKTIAAARCLRGELRLAMGDTAGAEKDFDVALRESDGTTAVEAICARVGLAEAAAHRGQPERAEQLLCAAAEVAAAMGSKAADLTLSIAQGRIADARGRLEDAEQAHARAAEQAAEVGNVYALSAAEAALSLTRVARGRTRAAAAALEALRERAQERGDPLHRGLALAGLARVAHLELHTNRAVRLAESAAQDFQALSARRLLGDAYLLLAQVFLAGGEPRRARLNAQSSLGMFEALGEAAARELGHTHLVICCIEQVEGGPEETAAHLRDALALLTKAGDAAGLAEARRVAAVIAAASRPDAALSELEVAVRLASEARSPLLEARVRATAGAVLRRLGQLDAARRHLEEAVVRMGDTDLERGRAILRVDLASVLWLRGDVRGAEAEVTEAIRLSDQGGEPVLVLALSLSGLLLAETGRPDESRAVLDRALDLGLREAPPLWTGGIRLARASAALARGEAAEARVEALAGLALLRGVEDGRWIEDAGLVRARLELASARASLALGQALEAREAAVPLVRWFSERRAAIDEVEAALVVAAADAQDPGRAGAAARQAEELGARAREDGWLWPALDAAAVQVRAHGRVTGALEDSVRLAEAAGATTRVSLLRALSRES